MLTNLEVGDDMFHSQRRLFQQTSTKAGVPTYGYLFADPPSDGTAPRLGGMCVSYVVGQSLNAT